MDEHVLSASWRDARDRDADHRRDPDDRRRAPARRRAVRLHRRRAAEHRGDPRARWSTTPTLVLVYESGTIGAKPFRIPLSIGDGELAETADAVVSVPEMFNYWIGAGPHRGRLPRRRPGRPLRQPQLHRDRRLRPPEDAPARAPAARPRSPPAAARSSSSRRTRRAPSSSASTSSPRSATATARARASGSASRQRPDRGDHRPRRARARPDDGELTLTRLHPGVTVDAGARGDRLGRSRSPTTLATTEPADRRGAGRRCGSWCAR